MNDSRRISMLELDRHLSQSLEQARHAPVNVQRYGQPWVWMLSSDAGPMRQGGQRWMSAAIR